MASKQHSRSFGRGKKVSRIFVCPKGLLNDVEAALVKPVRASSEYAINRSRLIVALFELARESADEFDADAVVDENSLVTQLRKAIVRSAKKK